MSDCLYSFKSLPVKIFVGQIPKVWVEEETKAFFQNFGVIMEATVIRDLKGTHKGAAFVIFSSLTEAEVAMEALNDNFFLPGSPAKLTLKWADGEAKKLGVQNIPQEHLDKLLITNIPSLISE